MMRASPFHEMDRLFEQMRRAMNEGPFDVDAGFRTAILDDDADYRSANMSVQTDDDRYVVHADLPGFESEEIDLRFDDGWLALEADHEAEGDGFRRRRVREQLRIPGAVDVDGIEADYRNGVLEVSLPRETDDGEDGHRIVID